MFSLAVASTTTQPQAPVKYNDTNMWLVMGIFIVLMYFILIRPQKKKEKENEKLRSNIDIGDEIITIGGIIGTVVSIKDDFIVIETSGDRNKVRITRWSIQVNNTAKEREEKEIEAKKQLKKKSK